MNFPDSQDRSISRASIVPFLVVFLIQYAQNLDTRALRLKLDDPRPDHWPERGNRSACDWRQLGCGDQRYVGNHPNPWLGQTMRWSPRGAHRVLQVRAAVLDGRSGTTMTQSHLNTLVFTALHRPVLTEMLPRGLSSHAPQIRQCCRLPLLNLVQDRLARPANRARDPDFWISQIRPNNTSFQKILSANRKRTIANMAKNAAISPPTTQKPFGLPLNGIPPTFMPQIPAISVAGRNIAENIVSM